MLWLERDVSSPFWGHSIMYVWLNVPM